MDTKEQGMAWLEDVDGFSRFTIYLERRRVMDVLVNLQAEVAVPEGANLEPGWSLHPVLIAQVDAPTEAAQPTKGFAAAAWTVESLDTGFVRTVQASSIGSYVTPRLAHLVARLFVPPAA